MISDPAADAALSALSDALLGLLDQDARPLCADGTGRWLSDDHEVRATVMTQCDVTFGIFAGIDYTASTNPKATP